MKKVSLFLVFGIVLSAFSIFGISVKAYSGSCGENLTWELSGGVLTISGDGEMCDYNFEWSSYKNNIHTIVVQRGVENIGCYAFSSCSNLISISLPDTIKKIGSGSF